MVETVKTETQVKDYLHHVIACKEVKEREADIKNIRQSQVDKVIKMIEEHPKVKIVFSDTVEDYLTCIALKEAIKERNWKMECISYGRHRLEYMITA